MIEQPIIEDLMDEKIWKEYLKIKERPRSVWYADCRKPWKD